MLWQRPVTKLELSSDRGMNRVPGGGMKRKDSRRWWGCIALIAPVLWGFGSGALAQQNFGEAGGFEVVHTEQGICEASRWITYRDSRGSSQEAAMTFGLTVEQGQLLALLGVWSESLSLPAGETQRGSVRFDDVRRDANYVVDNRLQVTAYMPAAQIHDIAAARSAELTLFDGSRISLPLTGTFAGSRLVAACYVAHLARQGVPNPFTSR